MKKAKTSRQPLAPRWIPLSVVGAILVFTGFAGYQVVSAAFTNPGCDPTAVNGPAQCNTAAPLLLSPTDKNTAQIVETPLQIGLTGSGSKDLLLYGNVTLSESGKMIQTATGYTGTAIDLFTSASTPALKVNNIGIGAGIQATAMSGNAIYASSAGSGNAALLEGPVVYRTGANTATLKVDSDGNLNIQTSVTTKGLTVNSAPVGGSSKSVTDTATGSQTKSVDLKPSFGTGNAYTLTGAQVLYWDTTQTGNNKDWKPMPAANVTYNECVNGVFTAGLTLVNPIANAVNYRIFITYTTATVGCPGADTTPPAITNVGGVGVAANWWVGGATTASPIALKATINDAGGVDNTVNFVKFKLDGVNINTTAPAKAGNTYTISPNWTPAFANNTTSPPVGATSPRNITVYACDIYSNCAESTSLPLQVTVNQNYEPCQLTRCLQGSATPSCGCGDGICRGIDALCPAG